MGPGSGSGSNNPPSGSRSGFGSANQPPAGSPTQKAFAAAAVDYSETPEVPDFLFAQTDPQNSVDPLLENTEISGRADAQTTESTDNETLTKRQRRRRRRKENDEAEAENQD